MKFAIKSLQLVFKKSTEDIGMTNFNFFFGKIGSGKSSLARLIDYCLGGELEMTPALQSEFVSAKLDIEIGSGIMLSLQRDRDANAVEAAWKENGREQHLMLPIKASEGILIEGTEVEVLSDLIFHLAGIKVPYVRKSQTNEESKLVRLSFRDIFWYCYLDQDTIDSSFFHLEAGGHPYKQIKSKHVLRFIVGYHQEMVMDLESELEHLVRRQAQLDSSIAALRAAFDKVGIESKLELGAEIERKTDEATVLAQKLAELRAGLNVAQSHAVETLRQKARSLSAEVQVSKEAIADITEDIDKHQRHHHQIRLLSYQVKRSLSAKEVLKGLEFEACPRCAQKLPARKAGVCVVCGQDEHAVPSDTQDVPVVEEDIRQQMSDLGDIIKNRKAQKISVERRLNKQLDQKARIDDELNKALASYDSAYLSSALVMEKERSVLDQEVREIKRLLLLVEQIERMEKELEDAIGRIAVVRKNLRDALAKAEADLTNLNRLEELFLDCLVRSKTPGFNSTDVVKIRAPKFLPEVSSAGAEGMLVSSFDQLGSGGKKTLFKCCFAIAVHRLAKEIGAVMPDILIIDSAMKNISERENIEQFEDFNQMVLELAAGELKDTQFILVDKEYYESRTDTGVKVQKRHMTPDDDANPPLIPYYRGA